MPIVGHFRPCVHLCEDDAVCRDTCSEHNVRLLQTPGMRQYIASLSPCFPVLLHYPALHTTATSSKLQVLSLSDNGKLSGSLASCWLTHSSLLELQLAGLSDLHGELPDMTQTVSAGSTPECGFGTLRYINMAGIIGDAGLGFTGVCAGRWHWFVGLLGCCHQRIQLPCLKLTHVGQQLLSCFSFPHIGVGVWVT